MRVVFLQEASLAGGGASANARRKVNLIRSASASCSVIALDSSGGIAGRGRLIGRYLSSMRSVAKSDVVYGRLVPRVVPLAVCGSLMGKRVLLEANGRLLENIGSRVLRLLMQRTLQWLVDRDDVFICGDEGHREYYLERWTGIEWKLLPLGIPEFPVVAPTRHFPSRIVFAGALSKTQGLYELIDAFVELRSEDPKVELHLFGDGPELVSISSIAESMPGLITRGSVQAAPLKQELAEAGVLVALYPWKYLPQTSLSSLKVLEYMATDRPVVVPARDSAVKDLGFGADEGVFDWDGREQRSLVEALHAALTAARAGARYPARRARLLRARGPHRQRSVLDGLLAPNEPKLDAKGESDE